MKLGLLLGVPLLVLATVGGATAATRPLEPPASTADDRFGAGDLARRVLAQHWKALDPQEQDEFVRLFGDVVTRSLARVRARTTPEHGTSIAIEYRLSRGDESLTVHDIVVDGVSLVTNYRSQLHAIIGASSVAGLLERMRADASWQPPAGEAVELDAARGRLMAGLLVGASRGRWTR